MFTYYIGIAVSKTGLQSASNSGKKDNIEDVVKWATNILNTNTGFTSVNIAKVISVVERTVAPVVNRNLIDPPPVCLDDFPRAIGEAKELYSRDEPDDERLFIR